MQVFTKTSGVWISVFPYLSVMASAINATIEIERNVALNGTVGSDVYIGWGGGSSNYSLVAFLSGLEKAIELTFLWCWWRCNWLLQFRGRQDSMMTLQSMLSRSVAVCPAPVDYFQLLSLRFYPPLINGHKIIVIVFFISSQLDPYSINSLKY